MWGFLFEGDGDHRDLHVLTHSCPTRRSSDLGPMGISLPRAPLLGAILVLIAINFASAALLRRGRGVTNAELTAALLFDVAALGWQLHHSGGLANPFASLFLQIGRAHV